MQGQRRHATVAAFFCGAHALLPLAHVLCTGGVAADAPPAAYFRTKPWHCLAPAMAHSNAKVSRRGRMSD
jgi:hypothetical protein